jgi:hypothetical protein
MGRLTIIIGLILSVSSACAAQTPSRSPELAALSAQIGPPDRFAPASPGALRPGKPAGIKRAQSETVTGAIAIGALAVIAIGGYALSTHPYRLPGATTATTSTQP